MPFCAPRHPTSSLVLLHQRPLTAYLVAQCSRCSRHKQTNTNQPICVCHWPSMAKERFSINRSLQQHIIHRVSQISTGDLLWLTHYPIAHDAATTKKNIFVGKPALLAHIASPARRFAIYQPLQRHTLHRVSPFSGSSHKWPSC